MQETVANRIESQNVAAPERAAGIGVKAVRMAHRAVNLAVLIAVLVLFAVCCYALWDSAQTYQAADAKRYEVYKPTAENEGKSFTELRELNPEVSAWLTVYGTNIDYPIAQGPDNMKYVNTDAEGNPSLSGAIYLDYRNSPDFSDMSNIIYGHHMKKNVMFGDLGLFAEKTYFDERRYGNLYYGGSDHGLEIFAFLKADAYDTDVFRAGAKDTGARDAYLSLLLDKAELTRDISLNDDDRILLLSTCSPNETNERYIVLAKISDAVFEDIFGEDVPGSAWSVDGALGLWASLPLWAKIAIAALPLLLLLLLIFGRRRRKKREEARRAIAAGKSADTAQRETDGLR